MALYYYYVSTFGVLNMSNSDFDNKYHYTLPPLKRKRREGWTLNNVWHRWLASEEATAREKRRDHAIELLPPRYALGHRLKPPGLYWGVYISDAEAGPRRLVHVCRNSVERVRKGYLFVLVRLCQKSRFFYGLSVTTIMTESGARREYHVSSPHTRSTVRVCISNTRVGIGSPPETSYLECCKTP